jgi:putative DNA primase/helicase
MASAGNNGKTTLLNLFRDLLGKDYSGQISIETVMTMKTQDATARADLADLRGARLVVTSEVEEGHKLNERLIKYLTGGGGAIKSCRKYENPIEFEGTHKLWMDCNHRPKSAAQMTRSGSA